MAQVETNGREEKGEGYGERNNQGAANVAEEDEENDDDETDAFREIVEDRVSGVVDEVAAVEVGDDPDSFGKDAIVQLGDLLVNGGQGGIFIGALLEEENAIDGVAVVDDLAVFAMEGIAHLAEPHTRAFGHVSDVRDAEGGSGLGF